MTLFWSYFAADYFALLEVLAVVVGVLILLSGLDDLLIDLWYWGRQIHRAIFLKHVIRPLTPEQLRARPEQPLAIIVPAWLEYDVIAAMIENMVAVLEYRNYMVFVGTYVNDAATINEVERMRRRYKQLQRVEVPHAGPTCKADCLNWVVQAVLLHEQTTGVEFAGLILHDSEDVLHPLELKFFNYLLPRMDMVQLPVASLEREWYELVAGTYMDEFAETHTKDMAVRESVAGMVPSAGVGTCFSRRAMLALAAETQNQPFNVNSLTEDYDIGSRLSQMGLRTIFASMPVEYVIRRRAWFGWGKLTEKTMTMPLSVREFFPDGFRAAYRQRARWTLGIGLQSWEQLHFRGSLAARYLMLRDRKGIVTTFVSLFAYFLGLQFFCFYLAAITGIWTVHYPPTFAASTWAKWLLYANMFLLMVRIGHRFYFVERLYGWEHGLLSVPRMVVGNFINFMAAARAWKMFLLYLFLGQRLAWDKTMHDFPSTEQLARQRERLGDILQVWQVLDESTLEQALNKQAETQRPLGRILISQNLLDEETLAEALAYQSGLSRGAIDADRFAAHMARIPADLCVRMRAICIGEMDGGRLVIGVVSPLFDEEIEQLTALTGQTPIQQILRESEVTAGLRFLRGDKDAFSAVADGATTALPLGDLLIEQGLLEREAYEAAMQRYHPSEHGRIGDYLVDTGLISRDIIEMTVRYQHRINEAGEVKAA
jgi:adsorption protein B